MAVTRVPAGRLNELGPLARREVSFRGSNLKLAGHRWQLLLLTTRTQNLGPF